VKGSAKEFVPASLTLFGVDILPLGAAPSSNLEQLGGFLSSAGRANGMKLAQ